MTNPYTAEEAKRRLEELRARVLAGDEPCTICGRQIHEPVGFFCLLNKGSEMVVCPDCARQEQERMARGKPSIGGSSPGGSS
jgi:hypothetical protein